MTLRGPRSRCSRGTWTPERRPRGGRVLEQEDRVADPRLEHPYERVDPRHHGVVGGGDDGGEVCLRGTGGRHRVDHAGCDDREHHSDQEEHGVLGEHESVRTRVEKGQLQGRGDRDQEDHHAARSLQHRRVDDPDEDQVAVRAGASPGEPFEHGELSDPQVTDEKQLAVWARTDGAKAQRTHCGDRKEEGRRHGCTVNDVIVSMCAGAVRRWLLEHDELPGESLVAQVPISVRSSEEAGTYGNRIMLMGAPLFTDVEDPVERLLRTHEALQVMKDRHSALPAELLQDTNHFIPPAVFSRAARLTFSLATSGAGRPTWNLVISNVPGPQFPLYCAGARLEANYPVSVITDAMGLNITVMSYCGHLDFGIVADREQMKDVWCLIGWLEDALAELEAPPKKSGGRRKRPRAKKGAARK